MWGGMGWGGMGCSPRPTPPQSQSPPPNALSTLPPQHTHTAPPRPPTPAQPIPTQLSSAQPAPPQRGPARPGPPYPAAPHLGSSVAPNAFTAVTRSITAAQRAWSLRGIPSRSAARLVCPSSRCDRIASPLRSPPRSEATPWSIRWSTPS